MPENKDAEASIDPESFPLGSPVRIGPTSHGASPQPGVGLCLSGGGYRAMLFHVGVLKRLNAAGWLPKLDRVSSVSGGSITAGVLGNNWGKLDFKGDVAGNFDELVTEPIRRLAHIKIDAPAVIEGGLLPFVSVSDRVVEKLNKHLFDGATLQSLPDSPVFVINATNLETGVLMRFSKRFVADYLVGQIDNPEVPLAAAVAASSAFPPFLSPFEIDLSNETWRTVDGNKYTSPGYRSKVLLSDGGVYDNMGIETVWKKLQTILVSDAGGHFAPDENPASDWGRGLLRVLHVMDSQVRALRRRAVVDSFTSKNDPHNGFLISTVTDFTTLRRPKRPFMDVDHKKTLELAKIPTRLTDTPDDQQEMLINWGFAAADAGLLISGLVDDLDVAPYPYPGNPITTR
jgi:NTE family protein